MLTSKKKLKFLLMMKGKKKELKKLTFSRISLRKLKERKISFILIYFTSVIWSRRTLCRYSQKSEFVFFSSFVQKRNCFFDIIKHRMKNGLHMTTNTLFNLMLRKFGTFFKENITTSQHYCSINGKIFSKSEQRE